MRYRLALWLRRNADATALAVQRAHRIQAAGQPVTRKTRRRLRREARREFGF
jgi:hypothetical protein